MDLAVHLGEQEFRWVFVVHQHGSPLHLHALSQAGDFFHDTYGGYMVNLGVIAGLNVYNEIFEQSMTAAERAEEGWTIHAGMRETSEALYLRPDLVNPAYTQARALSVRSGEDVLGVASRPDWPGYFGSPRLARAELGERALKEYSARTNALVLEILDGRDYPKMPRLGTAADLKNDPVAQNTLKHERAMEQQQTDWLRRHE
jgi:creatinine amidohydrolase/Fe(II)-dependent formamide hydrolase-like protein